MTQNTWDQFQDAVDAAHDKFPQDNKSPSQPDSQLDSQLHRELTAICEKFKISHLVGGQHLLPMIKLINENAHGAYKEIGEQNTLIERALQQGWSELSPAKRASIQQVTAFLRSIPMLELQRFKGLKKK